MIFQSPSISTWQHDRIKSKQAAKNVAKQNTSQTQ